MPLIQWLTKWMFRGAFFFAFFALFAFALNNPHEVAVHFFFGTVWRTSVVMLVLVVFAAGLVLGVLAMVPRWWRQRRTTIEAASTPATTGATINANANASASAFGAGALLTSNSTPTGGPIAH